MDTVIISMIIANSVSILTLAASIIVQIIENKKNRYVSKITTETIGHSKVMRECSTTILSLTNPLRLTPELFPTTEEKNSLIRAATKLEIQLVIIFKMEVEILTSMRKLINAYTEYLANPSEEQREKVIKLRENFHLLVTIYDYADWKYIKAQIKGQKNVKDFESICDEQRQEFMSAKLTAKLPDWKFFNSVK